MTAGPIDDVTRRTVFTDRSNVQMSRARRRKSVSEPFYVFFNNTHVTGKCAGCRDSPTCTPFPVESLSFLFFLLASTRIVDSVTAGEVDRCSLPLPRGGGREEEEEDIRFLASYGFRGNRKKKKS